MSAYYTQFSQVMVQIRELAFRLLQIKIVVIIKLKDFHDQSLRENHHQTLPVQSYHPFRDFQSLILKPLASILIFLWVVRF